MPAGSRSTSRTAISTSATTRNPRSCAFTRNPAVRSATPAMGRRPRSPPKVSTPATSRPTAPTTPTRRPTAPTTSNATRRANSALPPRSSPANSSPPPRPRSSLTRKPATSTSTKARASPSTTTRPWSWSTKFGAGAISSSRGVAINPAAGRAYTTSGNNIVEFEIVQPPFRPVGSPAVLHGSERAGVRSFGDFQVSPDGRYAAFASNEQLSGYANLDHSVIYRYDAVDEEVDCASCSPTLGAPVFDTALPAHGLALADDGRVFFTTREGLTLRDTNESNDAYEWSEGRTQLISTGIGPAGLGSGHGKRRRRQRLLLHSRRPHPRRRKRQRGEDLQRSRGRRLRQRSRPRNNAPLPMSVTAPGPRSRRRRRSTRSRARARTLPRPARSPAASAGRSARRASA